MPDTLVSAEILASGFLPGHEFYVNEAGSDRKANGQQVFDAIGNTLRAQSVADQTINAAVTAYLAGSALAVPAGKLRIGTRLRWKLSLSKTAAGTAANTFNVRIGTLGTTGDAAVLTFALPVGTAVADVGGIEIFLTVRGPLSGACVVHGQLVLWHNLAATGLATLASPTINAQATFDATVASLIVGLSCTTAASTVLTFQQVNAQAENL
jgi:hypothetical protein